MFFVQIIAGIDGTWHSEPLLHPLGSHLRWLLPWLLGEQLEEHLLHRNPPSNKHIGIGTFVQSLPQNFGIFWDCDRGIIWVPTINDHFPSSNSISLSQIRSTIRDFRSTHLFAPWETRILHLAQPRPDTAWLWDDKSTCQGRHHSVSCSSMVHSSSIPKWPLRYGDAIEIDTAFETLKARRFLTRDCHLLPSWHLMACAVLTKSIS